MATANSYIRKTHLAILCAALMLSCSDQNETDDSPEENPPSALTQVKTLGDERGNGGDVVNCRRRYSELGNRKIMFLDEYETINARNFTLSYEPGSTPQEIAHNTVERWRHLDPDRIARWQELIDQFNEDVFIAANMHLPDMTDDGPVALPGPDCTLDQIVVQFKPQIEGDPWYYIKKELWDQLTPTGQASLILHETLYRDVLDTATDNASTHRQTSRLLRYYNAHFLGNQIADLDEYLDLLRDSRFDHNIRTVGGVPCPLGGLSFNADNSVSTCSFESTEGAEAFSFTLLTDQPIEYKQATFWSNQKLKSLSFAKSPIGTIFNLSKDCKWQSTREHQSRDHQMEKAGFDQTGRLKSLTSVWSFLTNEGVAPSCIGYRAEGKNIEFSDEPNVKLPTQLLKNVESLTRTQESGWQALCEDGTTEDLSGDDLRTGNLCPHNPEGWEYPINKGYSNQDGTFSVTCNNGRRLVVGFGDMLTGARCNDPATPEHIGFVQPNETFEIPGFNWSRISSKPMLEFYLNNKCFMFEGGADVPFCYTLSEFQNDGEPVHTGSLDYGPYRYETPDSRRFWQQAQRAHNGGFEVECTDGTVTTASSQTLIFGTVCEPTDLSTGSWKIYSDGNYSEESVPLPERARFITNTVAYIYGEEETITMYAWVRDQ